MEMLGTMKFHLLSFVETAFMDYADSNDFMD